ncbi:Na+/H+ antiporter NhaC family protein [Biformimicrobium ophioploci]|uniref:Na+/H+ antiporter NhaC family protein n=1 Tax=Biformimicrobium ophioploci TaxID=3036711 RepID=A0ABQ6M047_9GAMM|nr:Na+/H+ antiporter NhaC family protein [Microbulbifer sp. NKW57]GMG87729.1 Na+/H+ antiporter NhaC family protein [Microbulbifer sp. NKW57]
MAATLIPCMLMPAGAFAADGSHAGWVSIVPPLLAIVLALLLRQVLPALFAGVWVGAWAIEGGGLSGLLDGLLRTGDTYIVGALADSDHAAIIVFSMVIGGMVGVVSRNGGMQGIVARLVRWAGNARRAALATAGMGLAIFFDDYSNTLVVGNTMRPVTDRLKISREKLAYIVDSTAAPVCCIALVTTWIGFEVGLISDALQAAGSTLEPYSVFLNSIPFSFYPLLAIFFVLLVAATGRDFGPMLAAERRARGGDCCGVPIVDNDLPLHDVVEPLPDRPVRAINALLPLLTLIIGVVVGLGVTGGGGDGKTVADILAAADSYKALMWAAIASSLVAVVLSVAQRILTLEQAMNAWFIGVRSMLFAMLILILAWSLAGVTDALGTARFLVEQIGSSVAPFLLPTLVFLVAAATAFSTGTSWGTMGILMPLVVPLAWAICGGESAIPAGEGQVFYASIASVLAGAIWGDHCSPISDTTILSSMASGCDHVEHVRTQLPYATVVAAVAILCGSLPAGLGLAPWLSLLVSMLILLMALFYFGQRDEVTLAGKLQTESAAKVDIRLQ